MTFASRLALVQLGRPFKMTLPPPATSGSRLGRLHLINLYSAQQLGTPRCGWLARRMRNGFVATRAERIWMSSGRRVSIFDVEACP